MNATSQITEKEWQEEEKACQLRTRIFLMYPFCDMAKKMFTDEEQWGLLEGKDYYTMELQNYSLPFRDGNKKTKLLLTPLTKATNKDILTVCEAFFSIPLHGRNKKFFKVERKGEDWAKVDNKYNDYSYEIDLTDGEIMVYNQGELESSGSSVNSIDKWRELGYALPYDDKSIFDMGIAVDRTTFTLTPWA